MGTKRNVYRHSFSRTRDAAIGLFLISLALHTSSIAYEWSIEFVDTLEAGVVLTDRCLRLDKQGRPHVAYGGYHLYYAWRSDIGWQYEIVDDFANLGKQASLYLDIAGNPHIGYYADGDLKYAYRDERGWHFEIVDSEWTVGGGASLVLDGEGWPHISYIDVTNVDVKYAWKDESGWHNEMVQGEHWEETFGMHTSMALDESGYPHMVYNWFDQFGTPLPLRYAIKNESGWYWTVVDGDCYYVHSGGSIAFDMNWHPHFSYYGEWGVGCSNDLKYSYFRGSGWLYEIVDAEGSVGRYSSIAVNDGEHPCVSYYDASNSALKHAYKNNGIWFVDTVDDEGSAGVRSSVAIDESGYPHIMYQTDPPNRTLRYAFVPHMASITLTVGLDSGQARLSWSDVFLVNEYWIFGCSNLAWFQPGFNPGYQHRLEILPPQSTTWSGANGIADPDDNWTYLVIAVDETESELVRSNRVGEWDLGADIP